MPSILRNDDAEALILDIRAARHAATQRIGAEPGAFALFPTAVVTSGPSGGQLVFPISSDAEPGMLVHGDGTATVSGTVGGVRVTGEFSWIVGEQPDPPPARYRFQRRGRDQGPPPWADQLPSSQRLAAQPPSVLLRQQRRMLRQGRTAEHWLLTLTERVVRHSCRGPIHRAIQYRPPVDVDDVVQRGMQAACRLLPIYASKDRPPCSWLGMLRLDGRRDMHREVSRLDWLPADGAAVVALADACGVSLSADPSATLTALSDAAARLGRPLPRIGASQVQSALQAPALVSLDSLPGGPIDLPDPRTTSGFPLVDGEAGWTTAAVARLVTDDPELIGLAVHGDWRALRKVGDQVLGALSHEREGHRVTRQRCWEEFQRSGRLFATRAGVEQFGAATSGESLAAIDESLRRAIGLRQETSAS
jgi:hypothetical protein